MAAHSCAWMVCGLSALACISVSGAEGRMRDDATAVIRRASPAGGDHSGVAFPVRAFAASREAIAQREDQGGEAEAFFRAKRLVFEQRWEGARAGMERYLRDNPSGRMRDEALYWLARSLDALARKEPDVAGIVILERSAIDSLDRLARDVPGSLWSDDARDLRVRIAGLLAVLGQPQHEGIIPDAASLSSAKSLALDAVASLTPSVAFATFARVLHSDPDPVIRRKAVALITLTFLDDARTTLQEIARYDADGEVRETAHDALARLGSGLRPFALAYSCFDARVIDREAEAKLPAGQIAAFPVPGGSAVTADEARRAVEALFARGLALGTDRAEVYDAANPFASVAMSKILSRATVTQYNIGSFMLGLVPGSIRRTAEGVAGEAQFGAMVAPFEVNASGGVVLAARRDDRVAVMYLRTVPRRAAPPAGLATSAGAGTPARREASAEAIYCWTEHLDDGIVIRSTRCAVPADRAKVVDYARAVAEIPGEGGTWTLTGHILVVQSNRLIIGRMATLVRPDGTSAATADEVRVRFGDPSSFTARGGKGK